MSFSDLSASIDTATQEHLCDLFELRPVGAGSASVIAAMVDAPMQLPPSGFGGPVSTPSIQVLVSDRVLKVGDVFMPGVWMGEGDARLFMTADLGWRVAGAPTRDDDGRWQTAAVERYRPPATP